MQTSFPLKRIEGQVKIAYHLQSDKLALEIGLKGITRVRRRTQGFVCKRHVELSHFYCNPSSEQMVRFYAELSSNGHH